MRRLGYVKDWDDEIEVHIGYSYATLIVNHRRDTVNVELSKANLEKLIQLLQEGVDRL